MGTKIAIAVVLVCTFGSSFLIATALFDRIAESQGFYAEGVAISKSWEE